MSNPSILLPTLLLLATCYLALAIPGGRTKISDVVTNKEIQAVGKYSVDEYNKMKRLENEGGLVFLRVVEAEKQVVSGMKYYLTVEAVNKTSGEVKIFQAVVVVKPWLRKKELVKFVPSSSAAAAVTVQLISTEV